MESPANVYPLAKSKRLLALELRVRDREADKSSFTGYSDQIIRLLLEKAMELLPYREKVVTSPVGATFIGLELDARVCAVSIVRAGESMEPEFRTLLPDAPIGKMMIQRDKVTKQPKYYCANLPDDVAQRHVMLLEPMLATGGSATVAVEELLKRGVRQEHIIFVNLLCSPSGIAELADKFPLVRFVTASIEERMNQHAFMIPGIGDFGDRYFGTTDSGARV